MKKYLIAGLILLSLTAGAQKSDIPLYEFARTQTNSGALLHLYKAVYQECEIFVATGDGLYGYGGFNTAPSIALGRGCK